MSQTVKGVVTTDGVVSIDYESLANLPTINGVEIKGDVYLDIDTAMYYPSLSVAINDLNNDDWKSIVPKEQAKVACFYSDKGENVIQLLDDVSVGSTLQIKRQLNLILDGHIINLDAAGWLNFSAGKSAIWAQKEGSKVLKEGFESTVTTRMIAFTCEHMEIHGGTYRLSGTCICPTAEQEAANKTIIAQVFVGGTNNQFGLLDNCTVEAEVHFAENGGVKDYHTIAIQNSGKNTIINGGSWNVKTTGKSVARIAMNGGKLTAENANFVAESIDSSALAFENDKTPKLGELNIKNCSISATTAAESARYAGAIANSWPGNVCHISDSIAFTDSKDFDPHEDGLGTYAVVIDNAEGAYCYITNVTAHGTHSCLSNKGKMYVNGGRYTGFCHGGIYCSHGTEGEAFVNDAYLRNSHYEGSYTAQYLQYEAQGACVGGSYIGGGPEDCCSNITAYFDGCTLEGKTNALVMRGGNDASHGEKNNTAYLSNCNFIYGSGSWGIAIGDTTHSVYLGTNCNYNKEESNQPDCITYTNALYRKKIDDADLNTLVDYTNKIVEIAGPMIVTIWTDDNGELVADKTYEEIVKAYIEGREVVVDADGALLPMVGAPDGNTVIFSVNLTEFSIVVSIFEDNTVIYEEIMLADMIPTKVSQLENDAEFIDLPSCTILGNNLRRRAEVVEGYFISPSSGNPAIAPNCQYATVAIPEIDELTIGFGCYIYAFEASNTGGVSFWDKNMNNLGVLDVKDYKIAYTHNGFPCATLPVPEGAAYVRYTVRMWNSNTGAEKWNANQTMLIAPGTADDVQDPRIATICGYGVCVAARKKDKKLWALIGDSLTATNNTAATVRYHDYVAQELGLLVSNHARSGAGFTSGTTFSTQIAELAQEDCDIITIFTSGNDCDNDPPLGQVTDTGTDTLCGVINTTLDELFALKPFVSVGIITSCPWKWFMPSTPGNLMENYNNAIIEIAKRRGIPVLDLYHCSNMRPDDEGFRVKFYNENGVQDNGVHPNSEGHKILAAPIREFVRGLIRP